MTVLGLKEAVAVPLVRRLSDDEAGALSREQLDDRLGRAAWTALAEPGDRVASALVAALGACAAASAVLEKWTAERMLHAAAELGVELSLDDLRVARTRWSPRAESATLLLALEQGARCGARLIVPDDEEWPRGVDDLGDHAPLALWVRGNLSAVAAHERSIALVGARAATGYGEHITMEASAGLVDRGYSITSGAAYGVDGMAHRAALASSGTTVAFLAGGVDRFYPSGHDALLGKIVERGAVVSELPCGSSPTKWRFLQRNRLIAASSLATIVLEAGWRSGSLNTAGHAAALGRPLGAVPGPVTSSASAGCHRLIREFDAVCVTTPDEMAELAPLRHSPARPEPAGAAPATRGGDSPETTRVLDALSPRSPRGVDDLAARSGLAVAHVQAVLGSLDLAERVRERDRGWIRTG